ncbi:MAG TPA: TolC family protein [Candidatus Kapabacteria bacterium]|nr:TolC family protein [Candidatus Kapabacteria bacterium]
MRRVLLATLALVAAVSVRAQTRTLTVEEAILLARDRAPERLRTEAIERQADRLQRSASTVFTSRPELEVEYLTEALFGERDYELSIGLSQELPIWNTASSRSILADAVANAGKLNRDLLDRKIELRTRLLYNRAWALSEQVALGDRLIAASIKLVDAANRRLAAGDMSTLDRNTVVLESNRQMIEQESVKSLYDQAMGELAALTGVDPGQVKLSIDTSSYPVSALDSALIYQYSPDYALLDAEIGIAKARLEMARNELRPNPTLGLHYSQDLLTIDEDQMEYHSGIAPSISGITAPGRSAGVSLSVEIPITVPGLWSLNDLEVIEREAELGLLEAERAALRIELTGRLAQVRPKLLRIARALQIYRDSRTLIEQNHELLDRGYEGGELSVTELLVGRQQLIELQTQQLELIRVMRETELELQNIIGK